MSDLLRLVVRATSALVGVGGVVVLFLGTSTTACSDASQVRQVFMALDTAGQRPRSEFYTDSTQIVCNVTFAEHNTDSTVAFSIVATSLGNPTDATDTLIPSDALIGYVEFAPSTGISTVSATYSPPQSSGDGGTTSSQPFPRGTFECRVTVNGQDAGKASFQIFYPGEGSIHGSPCPVGGAAEPGAPCEGWVKFQTQCPSVADLGNATACVCDGVNWNCP